MQLLPAKKGFIIAFSVLVLLAFCALALVLTAAAGGLEQGRPVAGSLYTVRSVDNAVGVFKGEAAEPAYYIEGLRADSLPRHDRELLSVGIEVYTEEELIKIIEDLES
ncbi:MAG: hypothetical protein ACOYKJ_08570 [Candidatus Howiella sp.]